MTLPASSLLAIDFGAKLAGTTALCFEYGQQLHFLQSAKQQDADDWLLHLLAGNAPAAVYIDAPLSLPAVYREQGAGSDYFYRDCDRAVSAMSPMFLGGLTARAMRLRAAFPGIPFYEIYPGYLVRSYLPQAVNYKKSDLPAFCGLLSGLLPLPWAVAPANWHQADAALAWLSGWRHVNGAAEGYGNAAEGLIWV